MQHLAALTSDEVAKFVQFTNLVEAEPNQVLADIGEAGEEFYLILEGEIRLVNDEGGRNWLRLDLSLEFK